MCFEKYKQKFSLVKQIYILEIQVQMFAVWFLDKIYLLVRTQQMQQPIQANKIERSQKDFYFQKKPHQRQNKSEVLPNNSYMGK